VKESPAPNFDLDVEYELQQTITRLIRAEVLESAHDVADGGLFITLLESAMHKNLGFDITSCCEVRLDALLFGEAPSRIVVSVCETTEDKFLDLLKESNTTYMLLGHVTKGDIRIDDKSFGDISEYKAIYNNSLAEKLK
jgi:phosphoribosylformylglycinamidine synthase